MIDHSLIQDGDVVLDLCTGSGILGLYAARSASRVICTDINPRAIACAQRNADQNALQNIEYRCGNLFEPVRWEHFDYIVTNPPFVPIPPGVKATLHSGGGETGMLLVEAIVRDVETHLKPEGRMQLYSLSLGNETETLLESVLRKYVKRRKVTMMRMYTNPLPLKEFVDDPAICFASTTWYEQRMHAGETHLHSFVVNIEPADLLTITTTDMSQQDRRQYPDNWENWKGRFIEWIFD
ncbi:MAG: methyltransferase [archaeon]